MRVGTTRGKAVAGAVGLALVLSACGGDDNGENGDAAGPQGSVTIRGCNPENPLIPVSTNEVCGGDPLDAIFSKLIRYDPETAEAVNEIAESIESDDNQVWTVTLRDGWTFHDGTPITAHSFVDAWSWNVFGGNAAYALNEYFFSSIEGYEESRGEFDEETGEYIEGSGSETLSGLEVIDDRTFTITLQAAEAGFPQRLGYLAFAPMPDVFYEDPDAFGEHPIGSGPFEVAAFDQGQRIVLDAYDGYQGELRPQVDGVTFRMYQESEAAYSDLLADNVDVVPMLPASALAGESYKSDLGERYIEQETGVIWTLTFPPEDVDPELADPNVRKAISKAINRQLIIDNIFQGTRQAATGWVSPVVEGYVPDQCGDSCVYDVEGAQELLAASGFNGPLTLSYNADADHEGWVTATCNSIANALEIDCVPTPVPLFADFRAAINAREMEGMFRSGWQMDYPSIENFLVPIFVSDASANDADYSNSEFDELIERAAQADGDEAIDLYQQAERLLAEDMPVIPLWYSMTVAGYSTRVDNVNITPFGTVDLLNISYR